MEITQSENTINLTSTYISGHTYLHTIQQVTTIETTLFESIFTSSSSEIILIDDGYYIISEIRLPNQIVSGYYIIDEIIYDELGNEVTVEELLELDTTDTNIIREDIDYISYYNIETYLITLIKNKFLKGFCSCNCITDEDKRTIDTLMMGIEAIKNLEVYLLYNEIQRIIEQLSVCTGTVNLNCSCNG